MNNAQVVLRTRPQGEFRSASTELIATPRPSCGDGEALIKVAMLSIDPTIRTWMDDAPGYLPPIALDEVVRSFGAGLVVESKSEHYRSGDVVVGFTGWQEWVVASSGSFQVVPRGLGLDLATVLNVFGASGMAAYFGLLEVGAVREGDVVVVSGAAGATGAIVGQLARHHGASKVIGVAGGAQKCAEVVNDFGFDVCLDYHEPDLAGRVRAACPTGVDLYFDNVGGAVLDAVLANVARRARVVLCGAIAQYNVASSPVGVTNTARLIVQRARMEGFLVLDFVDRFAEAQAALAGLLAAGRLRHREHLVPGLAKAPSALSMVLSGANHGKTLVVVDETIVLD